MNEQHVLLAIAGVLSIVLVFIVIGVIYVTKHYSGERRGNKKKDSRHPSPGDVRETFEQYYGPFALSDDNNSNNNEGEGEGEGGGEGKREGWERETSSNRPIASSSDSDLASASSKYPPSATRHPSVASPFDSDHPTDPIHRWKSSLKRWKASGLGLGKGEEDAKDEELEVYADNNATTPMFEEAIDAMVEAHRTCFANPSSIYSKGKASSEALERSREIIAACIGAKPEELYFTSGATESNNLAIRGVMRVAMAPTFCALNEGDDDTLKVLTSAAEAVAEDSAKGTGRKEDSGPGKDEGNEHNEVQLMATMLKLAAARDRKARRAEGCRRAIVTTPVEHASVYETVATVDADVTVLKVEVDRRGKVDAEHFARLVRRPDVAMACIIVANNEIGTVQDVKRLAKLCRENDVHLHCDMTQTFGKMSVDMERLGVDSATMSAHKFHGPKGVGALYVRQGCWIANTCMTGGTQEGALRAGTENVAGVCGMATALQKCETLRALGRDREVREMRDKVMRSLMKRIPDLVINGDPEGGLYNTLSVCIPGVNSRALIPLLDRRKVYVNTGCACSKGQGSKTLKALGLDEEHLNGSLRISLGFLTTERECRKLCWAMSEALQELLSRKKD